MSAPDRTLSERLRDEAHYAALTERQRNHAPLLREAAERIETLERVLEAVQWNGYAWIGLYPCVECGCEKPKHASDCEVAAALAAAREAARG
jgi:hypothetical protein